MTRIVDRAVWIFAALLSAWVFGALLQQPIGLAPFALAGVLLLAAIFRPYDALLVFAALGPLATMLFVLARTGDLSLRYQEPMAAAFIGGYAVRRTFTSRLSSLSPWMHASTVALLALVVASTVTTTAKLAAEQPGLPLLDLLRTHLLESYMLAANSVTAAGLFVEGLLLVMAAAELSAGEPFRRRDVTKMLVIGAAAAATLNVVRIIAIALTREYPWSEFFSLLRNLRVNVHYGDLNAAGSYFVLALFAALGLIRETRIVATVCALPIAAGVWISGSRAALLAAVLVPTAAAAARLWQTQRRRLAVGVAVVVLSSAAVVAWVYYPRDRNAPTSVALQIRLSLARGALDMARAEPVFGVGIGRYYPLSGNYTLRQYVAPLENAHNNFLQILAELGVPGLLLTLAVMFLGIREGALAGRTSFVMAGIVAGVIAYLLTCVAGHPLLVHAAAYPFWIAVGLAAAQPAAAAQPDRRATIFLVAAVLAIAVSLPFRIAEARAEADLEHATAGFTLWQREPDGTRYRWAGGRSMFFVPSSAVAVRIPLRAGNVASSAVEVRIVIDGRPADRAIVEPGGGWITTRVLLPQRTTSRFRRIDLEAVIRGAPRPADAKATDTNGLLMVGRPEFEIPNR